jgi:hypothetical protein
LPCGDTGGAIGGRAIGWGGGGGHKLSMMIQCWILLVRTANPNKA